MKNKLSAKKEIFTVYNKNNLMIHIIPIPTAKDHLQKIKTLVIFIHRSSAIAKDYSDIQLKVKSF